MVLRTFPSLLWLAATLLAPVISAQPVLREEDEEEIRQREEWFHYIRTFPQTGAVRRSLGAARLQALRQMETSLSKQRTRSAEGGRWVSIGPQPTVVAGYNAGNSGGGNSSGRVSALAVDPRNPNVVYLGAATGGVWKTTDGGANWIPLTDDQPSLSSGAIALDPQNPDIVYVGTGEQNFSGDSLYGAGILKSTDGGKSWRHLAGSFVGPFAPNFTSGGARIGAIAVHPQNGQIILAGMQTFNNVESGIIRSTDGGETWTLVRGGWYGTDVVFDPTDGNTAYAALGVSGVTTANTSVLGVYKSTDAGLTWQLSNGTAAGALPAPPEIGRITLSIAASAQNTIWAAVHDPRTSGLRGLYRSTDGAKTWLPSPAPNFCGSQCWYDMAVAVHPKNPNIVVIAGLGTYRSLNGGASWLAGAIQIGNTVIGLDGEGLHVDHHALVFSSDGTRLYDGNDGGAWSTDNLTAATPTWRNLNNTLAITQFNAGLAIHPDDPNITYGGTQDNGIQRYSGKKAWDTVAVCGDAGWVALDYGTPDNLYTGCFSSTIVKQLVQGTNRRWYTVGHGTDPRDRVAFYPPQIIDPINPMRLYFGTNRLYQTSDAGGVWTAVSADLTNNTGVITTISVSPVSNHVVWTGSSNGRVFVTKNAHEPGSVQWTDRSRGLPLRTVMMVATDPNDAATAYVVFSGFSGLANSVPGHVFRTTDYGANWTDVSGDLPNVPVNDIAVDVDAPDTLYIGTDIGVFMTDNGGVTWEPLMNGLPRTTVLSIKLHRRSRILRAATHGRGVFELQLASTGATRQPRITSLTPPRTEGSTALTLRVSGSNFEQGSTVWWNGEERSTVMVSPSEITAAISASDLSYPGRATVAVFNPGFQGGMSNVMNFTVGAPPDVDPARVSGTTVRGASVPLVAGSQGVILGTNLAPIPIDAQAPPLPYTLGGATVEINGTPAPLLHVSPNQITFQVPWEMQPFTSGSLVATLGEQMSKPVAVQFAPFAPTLFLADETGSTQGAIFFPGLNTLAAPGDSALARPARRQEVVDILATGLGSLPFRPSTGNTISGPPFLPYALTAPSQVEIGGLPARVQLSAWLPGLVGVYIVEAEVPANSPTGDAVPVSLTIGGVKSNQVTMAVQ